MILRILTGLVLAPAAFWVIGWAPQWVFLLVLLAVVERGLYEYFLISRQAGFKPAPAVGYLAAGALCLAQAADLRWPGTLGMAVPATLIVSFLLPLIIALRWPVDPKQYLAAVSSTVFGIMYVGFMLSMLVPLRFSVQIGAIQVDGRNLTILLFLVIWAGDIFAYFVGKWIGRTRLVPRISPGKTVEGSIGGFLGSLLVAWVFARFFWQTDSLKKVILWAGWIAVSGQVGDLVESAIKRAGDIKDSGTLLPGHGGLLDRIDSLILAVPALWIAVVLDGFWK
jgi:phosphatidate cytidylyltransferase